MSALASLANSDSPQIKLIQEWGLAFDKKNLDLIAKTLHKDYRHTTYPQSLGKPEKTRKEWLEHIAGVIGLWTEQDVSHTQSCYQLPFNSPWLIPPVADYPFSYRSPGEGYRSRPYPIRFDQHRIYLTWHLPHT